MAKSMFEVIESGKIEVNHNGEDMIFETPQWMKDIAGCIENLPKLIKTLTLNGILLAILHAGIAKTIIDLRAIIRPADIAGEKKGDKIKVSLIADFDNAQKRANEFKPTKATRPGTRGKTPEQRMASASKMLAGLTPEQLAKVIAQAQK